MRLVKPLWLKHGGENKDFEVYSCHVSADGERLVTAAGDGYVRLWSTEAIYNSANIEYKKPRQLAALSYHSGTIHTVRFSGNNKYLASGADDKIICIYILDPNAPAHTSFGSSEAPPVENWRTYRRLIGHENDVQDLGWSHDSSILVSVGLDSRVVIWSGYTFEKLKTISLHNSHVKGITFDPANKYFATASDDRSIKVFRYTSPSPNSTAYDQTNNFMLETSITAPFTSSPLTTYFRRCSWSPEGGHIAAANAINGPVSTVAIISRGTWDSEINLIGHEAPVEVCAFSPRLFAPTSDIATTISSGADAMTEGSVTVIACAGQDRGLSVWNTSNTKPILVTESLCMKSISDLAWSPDGERLFITSLDGSIALALFVTGELGYVVAPEVNEKSLAKYGAGRKVGLVENADGLILEEQSKSDELKTVQGRMVELMGDDKEEQAAPGPKPMTTNGASTSAIINGDAVPSVQIQADDANAARIEKLKQRVTITKDGKKRIAPLLISSAAGTTESSLPRTQLMSSVNQTVRNDAPQSVLDLSKPYDGLPKGGLASLLFGNKTKLAESGAEDDNGIGHRVAAAERDGATAILANTSEGLVMPESANLESNRASAPSIRNPALIVSRLRLAIPSLRPHILRPLSGPATETSRASKPNSNDEPHSLEVRNPTGPSRTGRAQDKEPARITVSKRGQMLWQDFLPRAVSLVTGSARFWAAACDDGSLHTWTPAGRRMFNAFALDAQAVILDCRGPWLLCITAVGMAYVWHVESAAAPHPPVSLAPLLDMAVHAQGPHLTGGPGLVFARLNSEGRIVVAMSNGDAFAYSPAMFVWQRLSEAWWAVGSQYWNSTETALAAHQATSAPARSSDRGNPGANDDVVRLENISAGIIPLLERTTTVQTLLRGRAYFLQRLVKALLSAEGYEGFESGVSVAHLENRLAAALTLGARDEFRLYLTMYAKRLGAEGARLKIEELLRGLLHGVYDHGVVDVGPDGVGAGAAAGSSRTLGGASAELCGWKKESLLRDVVLILGRFYRAPLVPPSGKTAC